MEELRNSGLGSRAFEFAARAYGFILEPKTPPLCFGFLDIVILISVV